MADLPPTSLSAREEAVHDVSAHGRLRARGILMLAIATAAWGCSFPLTKACLLVFERVQPGGSSWTHAGLLLIVRFTLAALLLGIWQYRTLRTITAGELRQGIGLGLFATLGSLLQTDGLKYTEASTSAFLTQFTCVLVPVVIGVQRRRFPGARVIASCAVVLAGVAVLSGISWATLRIGRGEAETLLCAVFYTGQILCLEVTRFRSNDPMRSTFVMFATVALALIPLVAPQLPQARDFVALLSTPIVWTPMLALVVLCTVFAFGMMTRWQPHVGAVEAGLIYSAEPLCTSLVALFLPAMLSALMTITYANENLTWRLLVGGALITSGNILMLAPFPPRKVLPSPSES